MLRHVRRAMIAGYSFARAELVLLLALLIVAGGLLAFLELADEMAEGDSRHFDRAILLALRESQDLSQPLGPEWLVKSMVDITALGGGSVLTLLSLFTMGYLFVSGKRATALLVPVSVGGSALAMDLLKESFARTRPDVVPHLVEVTSASFPSGHAMMASAAYLTLGVIMAEASRRRVGIYVMVCAVLASLLIGFSRVYLGVHWPTDVLAGWCAGAAWAVACWLVTYRFVTREPPADVGR